jgi:hypothetical protein
MESEGIVLGVFIPHIFNLDKGRYLSVEILHLLPDNDHAKATTPHAYYSP